MLIHCSTHSTAPSTVFIEANGLNRLAEHLNPIAYQYSGCLILSSPQVFQLYGAAIKQQLAPLPVYELLIPNGEQSKSLHYAAWCWEEMAELKLDRKTLIIALGGGTVTDLAGFVAACYMRGIDFISIPTTLMAMVDAAIGGKTAVNLTHSKNLVGVFYYPKFILMDPICLRTLPPRELSAGLAEIIKYGMISSPELFEWLEQNISTVLQGDEEALEQIIRQACTIKTEIVIQDPYDKKGIRNILNYGHTFAHAIEALTDFTQYLHGEAVTIGMSCAAYLSYHMGKIDRSLVQRQDDLCNRAGLPTQLPQLQVEELIDKMRLDKKAHYGQINLILPEELGKVAKVSNVDAELIREALHAKIKQEASNVV